MVLTTPIVILSIVGRLTCRVVTSPRIKIGAVTGTFLSTFRHRALLHNRRGRDSLTDVRLGYLSNTTDAYHAEDSVGSA